jgi:hypothetical protein
MSRLYTVICNGPAWVQTVNTTALYGFISYHLFDRNFPYEIPVFTFGWSNFFNYVVKL